MIFLHVQLHTQKIINESVLLSFTVEIVTIYKLIIWSP